MELIQSYYEDTDASVQGKVYALGEAGLIGCDISLFSFRFYRMAPGLFNEDAEEVAATQTAAGFVNSFFRSTTKRPTRICLST